MPGPVLQQVDSMTDQALFEYDDMMTECLPVVENFASLAVAVWTDVLKELGRRGRVELLSGSFDDIGNARIRRIRPNG